MFFEGFYSKGDNTASTWMAATPTNPAPASRQIILTCKYGISGSDPGIQIWETHILT
jgi:hypothetical protein